MSGGTAPELMPRAVHHQVAVDGVRFSLYRADPRRRRRTTPALLLHGVPQTAICWRDLLAELARDRVVLAPDLKGLGGSEAVGSYELPTLAREIAALVLHEIDGPVDVVGHDWGGAVALALAASRPELVRRLVVINAPYRHLNLVRALHVPLFSLPLLPEAAFAAGGRPLLAALLRAGWKSGSPLDAAVARHYVDAYADTGRVRAMLGYYRANSRRALWSLLQSTVGGRADPARLPRVRAERHLVVWGARDPVLPISVGESVVRDLGADTTFVTVPGAGHFVVEEAPAVVVPAVAGFLREGVGPGSRPPRHAAAAVTPPPAEGAAG